MTSVVVGGSNSNSTGDPTATTWAGRIREVMGYGRGYEVYMRRSFQSIVLYEALRCIQPRLSSLRPFQRKLALMDQAQALLDHSLDQTIMLPHHKQEILWRTSTSRERMKPENAWTRAKIIEKEMMTLAEAVKPYVARGRSHKESVDLLVRQLYIEKKSAGGEGAGADSSAAGDEEIPDHWEHAHNNVLMAFRLYYRGVNIDPTFPKPVPPRDIIVPAEKPPKEVLGTAHVSNRISARDLAGDMVVFGADGTPIVNPLVPGKRKRGRPPKNQQAGLLTARPPHTSSTPYWMQGGAMGGYVPPQPPVQVSEEQIIAKEVEERRKVMKEVRDHLALLKEFEGAVPEDELAQRKQDLFLALPPAPLPTSLSKST